MHLCSILLKKRIDILQKLYALLLLAVLSITILPVKLLHRHEAERFRISSPYSHDQPERFTESGQSYCAVCLYAFIHHYLPGHILQPVVIEPSICYSVPGIAAHPVIEPGFCALRGPPSC